MRPTRLKKLKINKFRALQGVEIEFGTGITVICGKNGTSKSSILGIAAQIFSFEKDYASGGAIDCKTLTGDQFTSLPKEHFRFSSRFDVPGSLDVDVELYDGYFRSDATAHLELSKRGLGARPVVRKNSTVSSGNKSRNFTHPVIFLSLRRLQPIAIRDYRACSSYISAHEAEFIALNNELLNKGSSFSTCTSGAIKSAVAHADTYDHDSVSAGEDNAGQIVLAIMSLRKLKEEYADYRGGLLLIDEADAGLFPAAQTKLIDILERECNELDIQVVMTSHSPTMIEAIYERSLKYRRKFKTVYLSDTYGTVECRHDMGWPEIFSDLHTTTVPVSDDVRAPKVNVYFEDGEGADFFNAILFRSPLKKYITQQRDVSLGCTNYIHLINKRVPEFSGNSVIVLDADVDNVERLKNVVVLPGKLPPDQLLFEFLYNLPASDSFWKNSIKFTRPVLTSAASEVILMLSISGDNVDLSAEIRKFRSKGGADSIPREVFKRFYKSANMVRLLALKGAANPWRYWIAANLNDRDDFIRRFSKALGQVMVKAYGVDPGKLTTIIGDN